LIFIELEFALGFVFFEEYEELRGGVEKANPLLIGKRYQTSRPQCPLLR
jgi:hypothetical protein